MCETIPEVQSCCLCWSLRIGMMFISVISIIKGGIILNVLEQDVGLSNEQVQGLLTAVEAQLEPTYEAFISVLADIVIVMFAIHGCMFIIAGFFLFLSVFEDDGGCTQVFVWMTGLNVLFGIITNFVLVFDCTMRYSRCLLAMQWPETAVFAGVAFFYYIIWVYFMMVANSYVLRGDTEGGRMW